MKKIDPGVGAAGLIALATILACFLAVAIPVIRSEPPAHTSDWLGFAGGAVGGIMTLVAAGVAWFAVQRQISVQTDISASQNAIQTYNILSEEDRYLAADYYLSSELSLSSQYFAAFVDHWLALTQPEAGMVEAANNAFIEKLNNFEMAFNNFERATTNQSAFPLGSAARHKVVTAAVDFRSDLVFIETRIQLAKVKIETNDTGWRKDWADARSTSIKKRIAECSTSVNEYRALITSERARLIALKREIRAREGF